MVVCYTCSSTLSHALRQRLSSSRTSYSAYRSSERKLSSMVSLLHVVSQCSDRPIGRKRSLKLGSTQTSRLEAHAKIWFP